MIKYVQQQFSRQGMFRPWVARFALIAISLMSLSGAAAQQGRPVPGGQQDCENGSKRAQADLKAGKPKYYVFGIVPAKEDARKSVKKLAGIDLINMGCMVSLAETCYNEVVNDWARGKTGKTVTQLMHQADKK